MSFCSAPSGGCNFNPRPPRGERRSGGVSVSTCPRQFQSTLPARGATRLRQKYWTSPLFQSTLPARGATDNSLHMPNRSSISIHAPREGSDCARLQGFPDRWDFNPRSPRGERHRHHDLFPLPGRFQSTLPARGATVDLSQKGFKAGFQSTLPARGATGFLQGVHTGRVFQSTLPARGATPGPPEPTQEPEISIHAPREGSDVQVRVQVFQVATFQSTLPARGATDRVLRDRPRLGISIHAPREGSDCIASHKLLKQDIFQSTLPARGATLLPVDGGGSGVISIHAPREGSD